MASRTYISRWGLTKMSGFIKPYVYEVLFEKNEVDILPRWVPWPRWVPCMRWLFNFLPTLSFIYLRQLSLNIGRKVNTIKAAWPGDCDVTKLQLQCCYLFFCSNSSSPGWNGRRFADHVFKYIFMNEMSCILIRVSLNVVPKGPIANHPALV